jgi:hypothetical protein
MITTITITLDHALLDVDLSQRLRRMLTLENLLDRDKEMPWHLLREAVQSEGSGCIELENTQGWVAGWNIPGCLPDEVPQLFAEFEDACDYLAEELERGRDDRCAREPSMSQEELRKLRQMEQEYDEAAAQVRGKMNDAIAQPDEANPFWLALRQHVWWVAREQ